MSSISRGSFIMKMSEYKPTVPLDKLGFHDDGMTGWSTGSICHARRINLLSAPNGVATSFESREREEITEAKSGLNTVTVISIALITVARVRIRQLGKNGFEIIDTYSAFLEYSKLWTMRTKLRNPKIPIEPR
jgi:hypothetical protein